MNHIFLIMNYYESLLDLALVQSWIDSSRVAVPNNQVVQLELDRRQAFIDQRKAEIHNAMFEISRNN